jgi:VWFA-related protein
MSAPLSQQCAPTILLLAGLAAVATSAAGQQSAPAPTQPPAFRGATTLVPIDVRVLDRSGRPITDLTEHDFTVFEDGNPQPIRHFSATMLTPEPTATTQTAPQLLKTSAVTDSASPQNRRLFLIVLGRGRLQGIGRGVDGMLHFVRERLLPQDLVAVMAWNRATAFTTDRAVTLGVLERFRKEHEGIEAKMHLRFSGLAAQYGGPRIPKSLQAEIDRVFDRPGADPRTLMPGAIPRAGQIDEDNQRRIDELRRAPQDLSSALEVDAEATLDEFLATAAQTQQDTTNLYLGIEYMRRIEGEKHLVFVSPGGLTLPRAENDRDIAWRAADARVAMDIVHTEGMASFAERLGGADSRRSTTPAPFMSVFDWRDSTARTLAALTGGQFYARKHRNSLGDMDAVDTATRAGYVLGYYPPNPAFDGRFRTIAVKVNRPGATVLYRRGYFSRPPARPFDREAMTIYSRITAAANDQTGMADIPLKVTATVIRGAAKPRAEVKLIIDSTRLHFVRRDDQNVATVELAGFLLGEKGRLVGQLWKAFELTYSDERLVEIKRDGVQMTFDVSVAAPPGHVKMVVYDIKADLLGSVSVKVK